MTMRFSQYTPPSRWARLRLRLTGVSWFGLATVVLWMAGIVVAFDGAFNQDAYWVSLGFLLEVAAAVSLLISFREDQE